MDIGSNASGVASRLSNFQCRPFVIDGIECMSMEGFLQSLKFKEVDMQKEVCKLVGLGAKRRGLGKKWWKTGKLHWQGEDIDRFGPEYQALLDRAYAELAKNEDFKRDLLSTRDAVLTHSIGKADISKTILTRSEFCGRLMRIRKELQADA